MTTTLKIVSPADQYQKVSLTEPSLHAYLHIAAEIDSRHFPFYFKNSRQKKMLISLAKQWCTSLKTHHLALRANVFSAIVVPPGGPAPANRTRAKSKQPRYDLCILIEAESMENIQQIQRLAAYSELTKQINRLSKHTHIIKATNIKRIAPVEHNTQGVFLFNFFTAASTRQNIEVWQYTAGWFQQKTGLGNSTLLLPTQDSQSRYNIINHCRWDSLWQVLPSLLFRPTFKTFVLQNFNANQVTPLPILYRLA